MQGYYSFVGGASQSISVSAVSSQPANEAQANELKILRERNILLEGALEKVVCWEFFSSIFIS